MNSKIILCLVLVLSGAVFGCRTNQRKNPGLIAHIIHNGLSFSVAVDGRDSAYLRIIIPEKVSSQASLPSRTVKVRVLFADDSWKEGIAKSTVSSANGGWADVNYLFALGRKISVDHIHSVSISIDGDQYEICPY